MISVIKHLISSFKAWLVDRGFVGINFCSPVLTSTRAGSNSLLYITLANKLRGENLNLSPFLLLDFDSQT